jgi:hypothetical protein
MPFCDTIVEETRQSCLVRVDRGTSAIPPVWTDGYSALRPLKEWFRGLDSIVDPDRSSISYASREVMRSRFCPDSRHSLNAKYDD